MANWYLDEIMRRERLADLERAIAQQQRIDAVAAGWKRSTTRRTLLIRSHLLIGLGRRLEAWGQRLQHAPHAHSVDS